jgi:HSP20 family protein
MVKFRHQFPALFDRFFEGDLFDWSNRNFSDTNTTLPSVNIKESDEGYVVEMAAPGFSKEEFNVALHNDLLTISSEKKIENETKEGENYSRKEFSYQSFSRSFSLPNTVNSEKIAATYENGILRVSIPKKEDARPKPARQISVS